MSIRSGAATPQADPFDLESAVGKRDMTEPLNVWKAFDTSDGNQIVLLAWDGEPPTFVNMVKIDAAGRELWRAKAVHALEGVWTGLEIRDGIIEAYNCAGYLEKIDLGTGRVINRKFIK